MTWLDGIPSSYARTPIFRSGDDLIVSGTTALIVHNEDTVARSVVTITRADLTCLPPDEEAASALPVVFQSVGATSGTQDEVLEVVFIDAGVTVASDVADDGSGAFVLLTVTDPYAERGGPFYKMSIRRVSDGEHMLEIPLDGYPGYFRGITSHGNRIAFLTGADYFDNGSPIEDPDDADYPELMQSAIIYDIERKEVILSIPLVWRPDVPSPREDPSVPPLATDEWVEWEDRPVMSELASTSTLAFLSSSLLAVTGVNITSSVADDSDPRTLLKVFHIDDHPPVRYQRKICEPVAYVSDFDLQGKTGPGRMSRYAKIVSATRDGKTPEPPLLVTSHGLPKGNVSEVTHIYRTCDLLACARGRVPSSQLWRWKRFVETVGVNFSLMQEGYKGPCQCGTRALGGHTHYDKDNRRRLVSRPPIFIMDFSDEAKRTAERLFEMQVSQPTIPLFSNWDVWIHIEHRLIDPDTDFDHRFNRRTYDPKQKDDEVRSRTISAVEDPASQGWSITRAVDEEKPGYGLEPRPYVRSTVVWPDEIDATFKNVYIFQGGLICVGDGNNESLVLYFEEFEVSTENPKASAIPGR